MTDASNEIDLTADTIAELSAAYRGEEPLYAVEQEQRETLPDAFRAGEFGRRDAEWVVRWYFRRHLGAYPDRERRAVEERFESNPFDDVIAAITSAADRVDDEGDDAGGDDVGGDDGTEDDGTDTGAVADAIATLTVLAGVDVGVASAFLAFLAPESYPVVSEREWTALRDRGALAEPYPDPPDVDAYRCYRSTCLEIAAETDHSLPAVTHALWRLRSDRDE
ncbi:hypothetical protein [Halopenitus persicus]|uniref:hypothetical protein n=1 Tax=Halopenitus persicus TaxID=1048396 RepID=UPI0018EE9381|nr:hypothetical protein [Halopenitus persicus]